MMKNSVLFIFYLVVLGCGVGLTEFLNFAAPSNPFGPTLTIKDGQLRPLIERSRQGRNYFSYMGIPYAKPPIGDLRFQPPQPADPWDGVLDATKFGPVCAQFDLGKFNVTGEESCLFLNVFRPEIESTEKLPVMVFFHNGAYMFSSSTNYRADYWMDENIILVTFNFRLGLLGFLNAGVKEAQGNMGLKDQVLALKWVQANIDKFGGDRSKVTIFGDLAGGASVHYHMYSPMSKDLFSGAISQGGGVLCTWAYIPNATKVAARLGEYVGLPSRNMTSLISGLKGMSTYELVSTIPKFFEWGVNPINPFGPSVEKAGEDDKKFLSTSPYWTIQKKPVNNVPWIVGMNDDLGLVAAAFIVTDAKSTQAINDDWNQLAPLTFYYRDSALDSDAVSQSIRKEYFKDKKIDLKTLREYTDLYSHRLFVQGIRKSIVSHFKNAPGNQPVYLYIMSHRSNNSYVRVTSVPASTETGPTESDELQYLFNSPNFSYYQQTIDEDHPHYEFSSNFIRLWAHFATHRTTNSLWNNKTVTWGPANAKSGVDGQPLQFLDINSQLSSITEPFKKSLDFWDKLPINEYEREILSTK